MRDAVELSELYPLIKEVIDQGGSFRLYPRGTSMEPMLHQGDDSVMLGAADAYTAGDVLFYRRKNGDFIIHRLIEKRGGTLTMCGDHQIGLEYGIEPSQVLAKVVGYYKGEVYHSMTEPEYLAYVKKKLASHPFYRRNPLIYKTLKKIKNMLKKS
ncbi:MAG: S24/S26 family peptidase [Clostridia bacterium]|nr:S24/S26 family peptidase [Clostridia bacterium]